MSIHAQLSAPLEWPTHVPRTPEDERKHARFHKKRSTGYGMLERTMNEARDHVYFELVRFGAGMMVVSSDAATNKDEWTYSASAKPPDDPGVAVYFDLDDQRQVIAIDVYHRAADNLWAVGRTIEAFRQISRDGGPRIMRTAVSGFKALPERTTGFTWWRVLGFEQGETVTGNEVREAYKRLARERHPDRGGSQEAFVELQEAMRQGLAVVEGRVSWHSNPSR